MEDGCEEDEEEMESVRGDWKNGVGEKKLIVEIIVF